MLAFQERRLKIVRVHPHLIVDLLNQARNPCKYLRVPTGEQIPDDAVVISVHADWSSGMIELMIADDSFEAVADGEKPPIAGLISEWKTFEFGRLVEEQESSLHNDC